MAGSKGAKAGSAKKSPAPKKATNHGAKGNGGKALPTTTVKAPH